MQKNILMMMFSSKKCFVRILRSHTSQKKIFTDENPQMKIHRWKSTDENSYAKPIRKTHTQNSYAKPIRKTHTQNSYRWKSHTDENFIQMKISYRWKFYTDENLIQMKISYRWKSLLRSRSQYEYVTSSHFIIALNQISLLDSLNNSSVNRTSRFIDHVQTLSERAEKWTRDFKRKFYWTIYEEIHFMIFTSRSENDIKTTNKRVEIDIEVLYFVNRKI